MRSPTSPRTLSALADPGRAQILDLLAEENRSASALARLLPISRTAVMKQLGVLERAGLVVGTRAGREIRYGVQSHVVRDTAAWLTELADAWDGRLERLRRLAEAD